jgi:hypothetical protein
VRATLLYFQLAPRASLPARPLWDLQADNLAVDHPVRGIGEPDQHAMRSGRQAMDDQRLVARIQPVPGSVIDGNVQMADPRYVAEVGRAIDENDAEVFGAVLNDCQAARECVGKRRCDDQTRRFLRVCRSLIPSFL